MWENVNDNDEEDASSKDTSESEDVSDIITDLTDDSVTSQDDNTNTSTHADAEPQVEPTTSTVRDKEGSSRVQWNEELEEGNNPSTQNSPESEETSSQEDSEKINELGYTDEISYDKPPADNRSLMTKLSWPGAEKFNPDEELILATNPSIYSNLYHWTFGGIAVAGGILLLIHWYITGIFGPFRQTTSFFGVSITSVNLYVVQLCLLVIVGALQILYFHIRRKFIWYILTDQRTWVRKGVLSQTQGNLDHKNITNIKEINPYPERLFGVGSVKLFTASTDKEELTLAYLEDTNQWIRIIREKMQNIKDSNPTENQY